MWVVWNWSSHSIKCYWGYFKFKRATWNYVTSSETNCNFQLQLFYILIGDCRVISWQSSPHWLTFLYDHCEAVTDAIHAVSVRTYFGWIYPVKDFYLSENAGLQSKHWNFFLNLALFRSCTKITPVTDVKSNIFLEKFSLLLRWLWFWSLPIFNFA